MLVVVEDEAKVAVAAVIVKTVEVVAEAMGVLVDVLVDVV
jgi:hypothetical protein